MGKGGRGRGRLRGREVEGKLGGGDREEAGEGAAKVEKEKWK